MDQLIFGSYILKGRSPVTLKHGKPDYEATSVRNSFIVIPDALFCLVKHIYYLALVVDWEGHLKVVSSTNFK